MEFIKSEHGQDGVEAMAHKVAEGLHGGPVLWLICGGSNIPLTKAAMDIVRAEISPEDLTNLTLGLTDERYGEVGHKDSNWQQLIETGFDFSGIKTMPILFGKNLEDTVRGYGIKIDHALEANQFVVAQFGIGADGHVAGMLPHTPGIEAEESVFGYDSGTFVRVTITPPVFEKIKYAFAFVFGESKHEAVTKLWQKDLTIDQMPCQILKRIPECNFYSDQL